MSLAARIARLEQRVAPGVCRCGRFETLLPASFEPEDQDRPLPPARTCESCGGTIRRFVLCFRADPLPDGSRPPPLPGTPAQLFNRRAPTPGIAAPGDAQTTEG